LKLAHGRLNLSFLIIIIIIIIIIIAVGSAKVVGYKIPLK